MAYYQVSVEIQCPPEVVFRYVTDLESSSEWLGFEEVQAASGTEMAAGAEMRYRVSWLGRRWTLHGEITRYEKNRAVATRMGWRSAIFEGGTMLEPLATVPDGQPGTRLVTFGRLELPPLLKPLAPLAVFYLSRYQARELEKLKRRLEAEPDPDAG